MYMYPWSFSGRLFPQTFYKKTLVESGAAQVRKQDPSELVSGDTLYQLAFEYDGGQNTDPQSTDYPNGLPYSGLALKILFQMSSI